MYQIYNSEGWVKNLDNGWIIPPEPELFAWREYLAWLAKGNTPLPYVDPAAQYLSGAARQTRQAAAKQKAAQRLHRRGDTLGALTLLNDL